MPQKLNNSVGMFVMNYSLLKSCKCYSNASVICWHPVCFDLLENSLGVDYMLKDFSYLTMMNQKGLMQTASYKGGLLKLNIRNLTLPILLEE